MWIIEYGKDDIETLLESLQRRTPEGLKDVEMKVSEILRGVRERVTRRFANIPWNWTGCRSLPGIWRYPQKRCKKPCQAWTGELREAIERSAANIRAFHERQEENSWFMTREDGIILGQE